MNFLKNIFSKKDTPVRTYEEFWDWFVANERAFFNAVKNKQKNDTEKDFFDKLSPKLNDLKDGFYFVTGMYDDNTAELVITADGAIPNIAFVEELVKAAPIISNWRFTALKPAMDIENVSISMAGYEFNDENLHFYANDLAAYPDEIDITVVYDDYNEDRKKDIITGVYIFLDNYLGELELVITIDNLTIIGPTEVNADLVPIGKLKDFLNWRQKEFIEKYEGIRHNTDEDSYSALEAELQNGKPILAIVNTDVLEWDKKASHPWILNVELKYDGESNNGMPDPDTYELLGEIEDKIMAQLKDSEGYINVGRRTADSVRDIYLACRDFRLPSKVLFEIRKEYNNGLGVSY
ncbi:MAG TPA: DUF695 domain-containing protein, partial [Mucilaginibacter sp.]|nr:DUF695 domain-containing protein [Mucilaginibacter sp.]